MWTYPSRSRGSTATFSANKYCLLATIQDHVSDGPYLLVYNPEVLGSKACMRAARLDLLLLLWM